MRTGNVGRKIAFAVAAGWASVSLGFQPPIAERGGVVMRIAGFDERQDSQKLQVAERDAARPFPVEIQIENNSLSPVKGRLTVWLNDDWDVLDAPDGEVAVESGERKTLTATARARDGRALAALYPIHAAYAIPGGEALHPIAIFKATLPDDAAPSAQKEPEAAATGGGHPAATGLTADMAPALTAPHPERFTLPVRGEQFKAEVAPGRNGLFDGTISFLHGEKSLVFSGFDCEVDGISVSSNAQAAAGMRCTARRVGGEYEIVHEVPMDGRVIPLRARAWAESGALRIRWDMPGVRRDERGSPRYTRLAIGACSLPAWLAYAGFGNVVENPRNFTLYADALTLSSRHVGADYANGLSLVQASDIFPDRLTCRRDENVFALEAHHDATFLFIPSANGAFAAARAFRDISGHRRSPSWRKAATRMCIDDWRTNIRAETGAITLFGKYGLGDSILVKHVWQRWGYDYRLPEILPPANVEGFMEIRAAARDAGMLFCPHDNYIDFFPDAEGFSYDLVAFNGEGNPQKAWFNASCRAQGYRWAPHAFLPRLERNAAAMRDLFAPEGIFIDVFSAMAPMDYRDRTGRFYPKTRTQEEWGRAFDTYRELLGVPQAVTVSEGGTDALVGHLDAGQSDHFAARRWMDESEFDDSERTPWHDMATHGRFVLYAGGQGGRYCAISWDKPGDEARHGYGSDDYLSNTVIGGRTPMCGIGSVRIAATTFWLLHDVCASLALADFESLDFGGSIHWQHSTFSNGGEVWSNRATNGVPWNAAGFVLPTYGFYAKTPAARAGIVEIDGRTRAFSETPETLFVDARPPCDTIADFAGLGVRTDGAFRLEHPAEGDWRMTPLPDSKPFHAEIDLAMLNEASAVASIEAIDPEPGASPPEWQQDGAILSLSVDASAFAYRIKFAQRQSRP